ncbi:hypothetical protein Tco_0619509 [Tanacetum coccineum]
MSTPAHIDPETISQTDRAQSSRVPIPLPDDPYMTVRQAYFATIMDSESEPFEDSRESEIPQPLPSASSPVSPSDNPYLIVRQAYTLAVMDTESEPEEAPSETEEFQPLAARTTPPSLDYTPTSSNLTPISPLTDEELETSEPSDTRFTSSHSTSSSNSTTPLSPDHPLTQTSLPRPESHTTAAYADEPLGLGYEALRCRGLALGEDSVPSTFEVGQSSRLVSDQQMADGTPTPRIPAHTTQIDPTPTSPEWSPGSLPVSPSSPAGPTPIASPATTSSVTITVDEDEFLEGYDRVLRELYTKSRVVRDEIFSQCYMLRSLEQEQERATMTFSALWRPVLALESWAGHVDTRRAKMWQARLHHIRTPDRDLVKRNLKKDYRTVETVEKPIA